MNRPIYWVWAENFEVFGKVIEPEFYLLAGIPTLPPQTHSHKAHIFLSPNVPTFQDVGSDQTELPPTDWLFKNLDVEM